MLTLTEAHDRSRVLDWYRGLAILGVLWGHAGLPGLPGAYLLIDTFFVISGYLVSRSLMQAVSAQEAQGSGRLKQPLVEFFANRVRRIVIPLAATVLLTLVAGWFIFLPDDYFALAEAAQATLLLQAHLYALTLGSYFDIVGGNAPLLHTWSLSLEEWFYLITPVLVLPALIWNRGWWLLILGAVTLWSLHTAHSLSSDPDALGASYSLLRTRIWQFVLGAMTAILIRKPLRLPRVVNDGLLTAGLLAIAVSVALLTDKAASPGYATLPTIFGILAVLVLRPQSSPLAMLTRSVWIRSLGKKIYSFYLAHYPFMVYFNYLEVDLGPVTDYAKFLLAGLFSLAFYYAAEAPAQGWRGMSFPKVATLCVALFGACFLLLGHIKTTGGAPTRLPPEALAAWTARFDTNTARAACLSPNLTRFGYSCALGPTDGPFYALFGDSHSDVFATQLARVLAEDGIGIRHYWYAECPAIGSGLGALSVFSDRCARLSHEGHRNALTDPNLAGVIYAARWPYYLNDADPERLRAYWRDSNGLPRSYESMDRFRAAFMETLTESIRAFRARGVDVFVMTPVPGLPADPVKAQVLSFWHDVPTSRYAQMRDGIDRDHYRQERQSFDVLFAPLGAENLVTFLDVQEGLCDASVCLAYGPSGSLYYDSNHLNEAGARMVVDALIR